MLLLPLLLAASLWAREADAQTVQPSVSFTQESYPVWENAGTVTVTVKLASTRSTSTTVRISATQNTAIAGSDFVGFTDVDLTIPAGGLTASRTIQIFNDTAYENGDWPRGGVADGEEFFVSVVSVNGDTSLGGAETKVVIADDEYTACFHAKTYLVGEGAGVYSLALRLSRQLPFPVKVTNAVVDYLSTEEVDYEVLKGTHTFKPYTQDGAFEIWIKDDKVDETNELFRITALVPSVPDGEVFCSTDIIIRDDDYGPIDQRNASRTLYLKPGSRGLNIAEGDSGTAPWAFANATISPGQDLTGNVTHEICLDAERTTATRSLDATQEAGEDFYLWYNETVVTGSCVRVAETPENVAASALREGQLSGVAIIAFGDTVSEPHERVVVTMRIVSAPTGSVKLGSSDAQPSSLVFVIQDNDLPKRVLYLKPGSRGLNIAEGDSGTAPWAFANATISPGQDLTGNVTHEICLDAERTTATRSLDATQEAGEDFYLWYNETVVTGSCVRVAETPENVAASALREGQLSGVAIIAFGDTVSEPHERVVVTMRIVSAPTGSVKLGSSDAQPSSLVFVIQDNDLPKRVLYLKPGSRGLNIAEGDSGTAPWAFANATISPGQDLTGNVTHEICLDAERTTATRSLDATQEAGEDFYLWYNETVVTGSCVRVAETPENVAASALREGQLSGVAIIAFGDTVSEPHERVVVTMRIVSAPTGSVKLGSSDAQPSSLVFVIQDNDLPKRVLYLKPGSRGLNIAEGDSGTAPWAFANATISPGQDLTGNVTHEICLDAERTTATRSLDATQEAGEDFYLWYNETVVTGSCVRVAETPENVAASALREGQLSGVAIIAFGDTVPELDERVTVTIRIVSAPTGSVKLDSSVGPSSLTYTIRDNPPATTEFKLLDGGRSISLNEGQEATYKVVIGKPAAQALPCFTWGNPSVVRDVLFDRGKALDSSGCMKSWPGTPHVGYVIMDLYINTNDDSLAGPNPRFDIGLKTTRKDGSAEPGATAQSIGVTVVNDDHSEVVMVRPHPAPMTWVEVKEFFDNLSATAEDRKFSDGTFCNADTPGTRTVTAPGGSGSTRTCVKYFARHATHLKWSTGRATPFSYILRAWGPGEGGGRNFVTIAANTGYSAGKTALDQTAFACNSPEQRAREITISVREAADWSNELSSPALAPGSAKFPVCAHEMPGRDYTYISADSLPVGMRSEPPKDVDEYPATEGAYGQLPRAEIIVAESTPYVDIRNARKTKFVKEGRRARFFVELSGEAAQDVAVEWRVRPSVEHPRATLGEDVEKASGTLVIAQGETRGEIRVKTYEDSHDDDREKFRVRITSAEGAVIRQQRAHAIIRNDDPMPAAWLARFGRTVAEQALDGIAGRLAAPRTPGMAGTLAGRALGAGAGAWSEAEQGLGTGDGTGVVGGFDARPDRLGTGGFGHDTAGFGEPQSEPLTMRDALLGSRFTLTGPEDGSGGSLALWGRAAHGRFDGREGTFSLDGEATTALLGADYAWGGWLVGLALAQSEGEGAYRDTKTALRPASQDCPGGAEDVLCGGAVREGDGTVEASLTAALPYASLEASERLKLWGALGYGEGEVTLATAMGGRYRADTTWRMAAAGLRGDLLEAPAEGSGPALALTTDALWARTASEKTLDLAASASDVTRLRLGLEGSWRLALDGGDAGAQSGASLVPRLEVGARHDGGDAETGAGLELGGGLVWTDPALGLTLDVSGRTLIAHEDGALEDRGFAAALGFDPRPETERGPSFSLRQDFGGPASGGLDALFQSAPLDERSGSEATRRWTAEAAYGLPAFGGRWTASPHAGLGLSPDARDLTLGWRWTPAEGAHPLSFGLKATRRESDGAAPEHALGFEASARW